jgi:hypothetical protein
MYKIAYLLVFSFGFLLPYAVTTSINRDKVKTGTGNAIYFDGQYFYNPSEAFDHLDKEGYFEFADKIQLEFAYEDYLIDIPEDLKRYKNKLERFGVWNGDVRKVPDWIGTFTHLTRIKIFDQKISTLPPEIGRLSNLTELRLGGNQIESLPPDIGVLKNLEILSAPFNHLKDIPPQISNLENLEVLDLSSNNIQSLPEEIRGLKKLKTLYLGNNPLETMQKEQIKKLLPDTKIYF